MNNYAGLLVMRVTATDTGAEKTKNKMFGLIYKQTRSAKEEKEKLVLRRLDYTCPDCKRREETPVY